MRTSSSPRILRAAVLILLAAFLAASCATGSESTYRSSVAGEESAAARAASAKKPRPSRPPVESEDEPVFSGSGGLHWDSSDSQASGDFVIVFKEYEPTGTVEVRGLPPGASLYVNGSYAESADAAGIAIFEAAAGLPRITARAFGFEEWETLIALEDRAGALLYADMPPRAFGIHDPSALPASIDPNQPGLGGSARIGFVASARGTWTARVADSEGRTLRDLGSGMIEGESNGVYWNGRDAAGKPMGEGVYRVFVEAAGLDGALDALEQTLRIERGAPLRFSTLHGGFSGAMLAPDATVLADGRFQSAAGAYAFVDSGLSSGEAFSARVPAWAGLRLGGLFGATTELALSFMGIPYLGSDAAVDPSSVSIAASFKSRLAEGEGFAAALLLSGTWASFVDEAAAGWPGSWDGPARFPGLGAGLVLEARQGSGRVFASAEAKASTFYPGYDDARWDVPGFYAWAYLRGGAEALVSLGQAGHLVGAASIAARTEPVGAGPDIREPLSIAAELAWYAPDSPFVLSLLGAGEWRSFARWYFAGGLSIGLAF